MIFRNTNINTGMRMKTARVDFSVIGTEDAPAMLESLSNFDLRILIT